MVPHLVQRFLKHLQKYYFRVSIRMIHRLRGGGGGGGGFRPIILETLIMRYRLKGKATPDFFRVVL